MIRTLRLFLLLIFIALPFSFSAGVHCYLGTAGGLLKVIPLSSRLQSPNNAKPEGQNLGNNDIKSPSAAITQPPENAYQQRNVYAWVLLHLSQRYLYQLGVTYEGVGA